MTSPSSSPVEVVAVGDIHLARDNPESAFANIQHIFDDADIVIGNLEGVLSTTGNVNEMNQGHSLRSDPAMIDGITAAGFDLVSFANNHTMDYGTEAMLETIELLETHHIEYAGAGRNQSEAEAVATLTANGHRIGLVSFEATSLCWHNMQATADHPGINLVAVSPYYPEPHVSDHDLEKVTRIVSDAADSVDILFGALHAGVSIDHTLTVTQRALARTMIDAGVDAVFGHHPHTIQAIDVYRDAPIYYSLSNFVFDDLPVMHRLPRARLSGVTQLTLGAEGLTNARFYPVWIDVDQNPELDTPETDRYATIEELSDREGFQLQSAPDSYQIPL